MLSALNLTVPEWDNKTETAVGSSPSVTSRSHTVSTRKTSHLSRSRWRLLTKRNEFSKKNLDKLAKKSDDAPPEAGWPRLARELTETLCFESFCRFRELNVKNLLYYQAEIAEMEVKLRKFEKEDWAKSDGFYGRNPSIMLQAKDEKNASVDEENASVDEESQSKLVLEIRKRLKQYNKALLQHAQISALPQPDAYNVECLRLWMKRNLTAKNDIDGEGAHKWGEGKYTDSGKDPIPLWRRIPTVFLHLVWPQKRHPKDLNLVRTQPGMELDRFTQWVQQDFVPLWHHICHPGEVTNVDPHYYNPQKYSQSNILKITSFVVTVVACALPTVAIDILSTAKTKKDRLLYIGGFTIMFAIGLLLFIEASTSRINIFMATAAFSAVLVVFVQSP